MVTPTSAPGYIDPLRPDRDHEPGTEWETQKKAAL